LVEVGELLLLIRGYARFVLQTSGKRKRRMIADYVDAVPTPPAAAVLSTWTKFIDTSSQSLFAARGRSKVGGNSIGPRARTAYIASIGSPPWRGRRECASSEADFSHEDKRQALPDDLAGERWAFG
jgi:hypothetical protein